MSESSVSKNILDKGVAASDAAYFRGIREIAEP
jgi:hypothetical protein